MIGPEVNNISAIKMYEKVGFKYLKTVKIPDEFGQLYSACVAGASSINDLENFMLKAGFTNIKITPKEESKTFIKKWSSKYNIQDFIVSANIEAIK